MNAITKIGLCTIGIALVALNWGDWWDSFDKFNEERAYKEKVFQYAICRHLRSLGLDKEHIERGYYLTSWAE